MTTVGVVGTTRGGERVKTTMYPKINAQKWWNNKKNIRILFCTQ